MNISIQLAIVSMYDTKVPSYLYLCYGFFIFFSPGRDWPSLSKFPLINPVACHALPGAVFHLSKMRAHGAADARVTSGALYL